MLVTGNRASRAPQVARLLQVLAFGGGEVLQQEAAIEVVRLQHDAPLEANMAVMRRVHGFQVHSDGAPGNRGSLTNLRMKASLTAEDA